MKNQYFGDVKDLFKYDIVEWTIRRVPSLDRFTFITMLTPNDKRGDGNKLDYSGRAGCLNERLVNHLSECIDAGKRNVSEIRSYYGEQGIDIHIYGENKHFTNIVRAEYFADIDSELLENSLIFVDPDNGLEVTHSNERHLLYSEAVDLFDRMSKDSVLVLFQHFRREKHVSTVERVASQIEATCGLKPICIYDIEIALFFLAKTKDMQQALAEALCEYQEHYPRLHLVTESISK